MTVTIQQKHRRVLLRVRLLRAILTVVNKPHRVNEVHLHEWSTLFVASVLILLRIADGGRKSQGAAGRNLFSSISYALEQRNGDNEHSAAE